VKFKLFSAGRAKSYKSFKMTDVTMALHSRRVQKECGRLIHILTKKLKNLEAEVATMRAVVEAEEQTFSPNGMPLSPRLSIQPRSPGNMDWNDVVIKQKQKDDGLDIAQTLKEAKKKFDELDRNKSETLEGNEILALADWCWTQFPVQGKEVSKSRRKEAATDLLERTDHNRDGKVDFGEFAMWFMEYISKFKNQKLQLAPSPAERYEEKKESSENYPTSRPAALTPTSTSRFRRADPSNSAHSSPYRRASPNPQPPTPQKPVQRRWDNSPYARKEEPSSLRMKVADPVKANPPQPAVRKSPVVASVSVNHKFSLSTTPQRQKQPSPSKPTPPRAATPPRSSPAQKSPARASPARSSPVLPKKKVVRRQRTNEVEEPWMVLANFKTPAKNRVQLFLRLNSSRDNKLGENEIRPMLIKCGIPTHKLNYTYKKFCEHFGSNNGCVTFKQFEKVLSKDANEREIFNIVTDINRTE